MVQGCTCSRVQLFKGSIVQGFRALVFKVSCAMERRRLYELKYVEAIHVVIVLGPNGRVGIFPCLRTGALGMNAWT